MKESTKIIAMYLPQFHEIEENNKWWGKGYTDWVAVKKSRPLFEGHRQPRIPLNENYYDLLNKNELIEQSNLAEKYGIYGFGIYHYWFSSNLKLLEKPAEIILNTPEFKTHYFFAWDNGSWKRTWSNVRGANDWAPGFDNENKKGNGVLAELNYGKEEDWKIHFEYLLTFFKDERYIKIDKKPLFCVFRSNNQYNVLKEMFTYWDELAKEHGFDGIKILSVLNPQHKDFGYVFDYQPLSGNTITSMWKLRIYNFLFKHFKPKIRFYDYDKVWKSIIKKAKNNPNYDFGGFVGFDDTPRRGEKGRIIKGQSVEKFEKYLDELLKLSIKHNKEFLFLTAWNEWGEGAYLEPDSVDEYKYLEAVKRVVDRNKK